jgi:hypothetical protein
LLAQVLVTPVGRLKVCGLGVSEALAGEVVPSGAEELLQLQRDDVVVSHPGYRLLQPSITWRHHLPSLHAFFMCACQVHDNSGLV